MQRSQKQRQQHDFIDKIEVCVARFWHFSMAEWSKALVLGTSLFGGVGLNPTAAIPLRILLLAGSCKRNANSHTAPEKLKGATSQYFCCFLVKTSQIQFSINFTCG